jgi:hypothetical protein
MTKILRTMIAAVALAACSQVAAAPGAKSAGEASFTAYLTGYSYWDNTPPGSAAIARPVVHRQAGGKGTYKDPITLAVGHVKRGRSHTMDYPAGTRFYFPKLRKYAIVEDLCGDGERPQDGPCHSGKDGKPWLDIYVGGKRLGAQRSWDCMYKITGMQKVVIHPRKGLPVVEGPIAEGGCKTYQ